MITSLVWTPSRWFVVLASLGAAVAGSGCVGPPAGDDVEVRQSAVVTNRTLTLSTPRDVALTDALLISSTSTLLGARIRLVRQGTPAAAGVNLGSGGINAEPDGITNDLWSRSRVELRDRVRVNGKVFAPSLGRGVGVVVTGGLNSSTPIDPLRKFSWTVTYPGTAADPFNLEPDQTGAIAPGRHGAVRVASRARLTLAAGTYYLDSLQLEPQATVVLDQAQGPIVIYTTGLLQLRGQWSSPAGTHPDLFIVSLATTPVFVEAPFDGALFAPDAAITLRTVTGGHEGFFAGKGITVDAGCTVRHRLPPAVIVTTGSCSPTKCSGHGACGEDVSSAVIECRCDAGWIGPDCDVPAGDLDGCAAKIPPPPANLPAQQRQEIYQANVQRHCVDTGSTRCEAGFLAAIDVDVRVAGKRVIANSFTPAQYLAVARDRRRKIRLAELDATWACAWVRGDADDDFVPDDRDQCPATPALTATTDQGCPVAGLPAAPPAVDVRNALEGLGILYDRRCDGAGMPSAPRAADLKAISAIDSQGNIATTVFMEVTPVVNQPAGCAVWYEMQFILGPSAGSAASHDVVFLHREGRPSDGLLIFSVNRGMPGARGAIAQTVPRKFRVRSISGNGLRSRWSEWSQ